MISQFRSLLQFLATLTILSIITSGCTTVAVKQLPAATDGPKKIVIFFDGTHNNEVTDTNVKRLHSLVTLQPREDISTLYIEGVGTGSDFLGMAMGVGTKVRTKIAYQFLLDNYHPNDQVYIFGFSRGAYIARILASLLYYAGLPTHESLSSEEIAELVYEEVKRYDKTTSANECHARVEGKAITETVPSRRSIVVCALEKRAMHSSEYVPVELLGLWDTVEALGAPDWGARIKHKVGLTPFHVNVDNPNIYHGDQLCNVRRAYQALSIDDNREWAFTPLLLTRKHLWKECQPNDEGMNVRLREVWFSGAHSDVGGGYGDSLLSGVSLNWMIEQLLEADLEEKDRQIKLLHKDAHVRQDPYGTSHNPNTGAVGLFYEKMNRNIAGYVAEDNHIHPFNRKICVHESVVKRRLAIPPASYENQHLRLKSIGDKSMQIDSSKAESDPLRLKETLQVSERPIEIEVWPACTGMK